MELPVMGGQVDVALDCYHVAELVTVAQVDERFQFTRQSEQAIKVVGNQRVQGAGCNGPGHVAKTWAQLSRVRRYVVVGIDNNRMARKPVPSKGFTVRALPFNAGAQPQRVRGNT